VLGHRLRSALAVVCVAGAACAVAGPISVPPELEPWRAWVLQDEAFRQCPFLSSVTPPSRNAYRCAWPERLQLALGAHDGTFEQRWEIFADSWVRLPGDAEHWPQQVLLDGHAGVVVEREGAPELWLARGDHRVSGHLAFVSRPERLEIDTRTAIVELTLDGRRVSQPERPGGAVWLGKQHGAEQPQHLDVQVYRLLRDEVPARLITLVRLQVSGDGREELLSRVLPDQFFPLALESQLPARLEPDGRLRVQVRAGSWDITLSARGANVAAGLARPAVRGPWANEEIWSFAGDDRLRVAVAEGAPGIDPVQAGVPAEWKPYPAFRMAPDTKLTIVERARGLTNTDDNRLTIERHLWLDFERGGLTAVDNIGGVMRRQWRLETLAPFELESARTGNETLLITHNPGNKGSGVEVRTPRLGLITTSRAPSAGGSLPASGWQTRFHQVSGELIMPPGHLLLAVLGADRAPGTWLENWGLWSLFGVLVVAVFAGRLAGWPVAGIALAGLLVTYQEAAGYIWLWGNAIAALALARAAPEGRLRTVAGRYRLVSFLVLGLALLPFFVGQLRLALYPQLEPPNLELPQPVLLQVPRAQVGVAGAPAEAPPARAADMVLEETREELAARAKSIPVEAAKLKSLGGAAPAEQRYAPGTVLQAGPGIPAWRYRSYAFSWSGPVEPTQSVRFLYIGPIALAFWRIAGVALLAILFVALVQPGVYARWGRIPTLRGSAAIAAVLGLMLAAAVIPEARAASTPDPALLSELKTRLTRPPECSPSCSEITSATIVARDEELEISLGVSALTAIAIPLPTAGDHWQVESITLDGRSALAVNREGDGTIWVPLSSGAHSLRLTARISTAPSIQLAFPKIPRHVSVTSDSWDVTGVGPEQQLISDTLEFVRRSRAGRTAEGLAAASEFPPFVTVRREFDLGLDWRMRTTVTRIAPAEAALNLEVPLLPQEAVLSEKIATRTLPDGQRMAIVGIERAQQGTQWTSAIAPTDTLELSLPAAAARTEVWTFVASPQWNVSFDGLPAVLPQEPDGPQWLYEFYPRPGEHLTVHISRPQPTSGATLAIDSVEQTFTVGKRSADGFLAFEYRSTQGGRQSIHLPEDARVTGVELDHQPVQLRPDRGDLSLGLLPGKHAVQVGWTTPEGAALVIRSPRIDLHTPASNIRTSVRLPEDRWVLFATGRGVGPAILYWGELALFVVVAILLGRSPRSPLRTHEWLLLGLGLSTSSWSVLALVGLWLFAMRWRAGWAAAVPAWRFNTVQVLLAILTVSALSALVFVGTSGGLLAPPAMGIEGSGSGRHALGWFLDETPSELPRCTILSVPIWVYRIVMFAWALWVVVALMRWLRATWEAWKTHGIWRGGVVAAAPGQV